MLNAKCTMLDAKCSMSKNAYIRGGTAAIECDFAVGALQKSKNMRSDS